MGAVAAGQPLRAEQNIEDYFPIPVELLPNADTFMLRVKGDSMINAGILDGDQIMVEQTPSAQNGDIVVALLEDSATVKRFYREDGHYRLQPENDYMDPIIVDHVDIQGKVIGLFRRMKYNPARSDVYKRQPVHNINFVHHFLLIPLFDVCVTEYGEILVSCEHQLRRQSSALPAPLPGHTPQRFPAVPPNSHKLSSIRSR